jgi:hypothetical protein
MEEHRLESDLADAEPPLRVVVAYRDIAACNRAMRLLADVGEALGDDIDFQPLPWSFDLLADVNWRRVAASDAINADLFILATSDTNPLPPAIGGWAETAISRKRGTAAAVVALFGPEGHPDGIGSSRLAAIQTAAKRAGLDFFAPAPRGELDEAIARINQGSEMVTPLLHEILQHHSVSRRDQHTEAP